MELINKIKQLEAKVAAYEATIAAYEAMLKAYEIKDAAQEAKFQVFEAKQAASDERILKLELNMEQNTSKKRRVKNRSTIYEEITKAKARSAKYSKGDYSIQLTGQVLQCTVDKLHNFYREKNLSKGILLSALIEYAINEFAEMEQDYLAEEELKAKE